MVSLSKRRGSCSPLGDLRRNSFSLGLRTLGCRTQREHPAAVVAGRSCAVDDVVGLDSSVILPRRCGRPPGHIRLRRPAHRVQAVPQPLARGPVDRGVREKHGRAPRTDWPISSAELRNRGQLPSRGTSTDVAHLIRPVQDAGAEHFCGPRRRREFRELPQRR